MRLLLFFIGMLIATLALRTAWTITQVSGALVAIDPLLVDKCTRLDIAPGTEDIAIDHNSGIVFVGAGDRRSWYAGTQDSNGYKNKNGIYAFDPQKPGSLKLVSPPDMKPFLPHGISLWQGPVGERRLFVVNHPGDGREIVELFSVANDNMLTHIESIYFDEMYSPNDIVAVGPRQFYATNDRAYDVGIAATLELYLSLPLSDAVYFDGKTGRTIQKGLMYANGINQSKDGKTIYIAEFLRRTVTSYDRDIETGKLTQKRRYKLNTGPDNIDVSSDDIVWVTGHPKALAFQDHAEDSSKISPSHVVRINPENAEISNAFISTYGEINGSSIGAVDRGKLYVGAVFESHILSCPIG